MNNPVPVDQLNPLLLGCGNEGGAPATNLQLAMRPPPPAPPPPPPAPLGPGMAPGLAPGMAPGLSPGLLSPGMDPALLSPGMALPPSMMSPGLEFLSPGMPLPPGVAPGPGSDLVVDERPMPASGVRISITIGGAGGGRRRRGRIV